MTRIGAIDVGSNSVKLLVADVSGETLVEIDRSGTVTRLAAGLAGGGSVSTAAVAQTGEAIAAAAGQAGALGATTLVAGATGAMRLDPRGRELAAGWTVGGGTVPVLSGEVEASLALLGLRAGAGWPNRLVALDIGGSSSEVTWLEGDSIRAASHAIGAVSAHERCLEHDPPIAGDLERLEKHISGSLAGVEPVPRDLPLIAVGGTLSALAMWTDGLPTAAAAHGRVLQLSQVEAAARTLADLDRRGRRRLLRIAPRRADILLAGARILLRLMSMLGKDAVRVSAWGLRHGLALAAVLGGDDARHDAELARALSTREPGDRLP